jgi:nucleotide-binding universal stress UspA family protein
MRILVAVDLKSEPAALVDAAKEWAERLSSPLDLVYVDETGVPLPKVRDPAVQSVVAAGWHKQRHEYEEQLETLLNSIPEPVRGRIIVETGSVSSAVLRVGQQPEYGLLILGNDSRSGFAALLGSASEAVVRAFKKPVMLLRVRE